MWNPLANNVDPSGSSFLPEDYLERKSERRANLIYLSLFAVVIAGVVGAFFVTNQQWSTVKKHQQAINARYAQAAKDIEQLKVLEGQKQQMMGKAELTTALIEKAPRSLLLAELINRMPERLTLLELELDSKRLEPPKGSAAAKTAAATPTKGGPKSLNAKAVAAAPAPADATPKPPKYDITLTIIGVAPSHSQVAWYVSKLQECQLLENVELKFSESTIIDDKGLNKFRIESKLKNNADARSIEPIIGARFDAFSHKTTDSAKQPHEPPSIKPSASAVPGKEN